MIMTIGTGNVLCFDYNLQGVLFFLMLLHVIYLILVKKRLIRRRLSGELMFFLINATLLMILNYMIACFGFGLTMYTETSEAVGWLAWVGRYTWLTVTPVIYVWILLLCWRIKIEEVSK